MKSDSMCHVETVMLRLFHLGGKVGYLENVITEIKCLLSLKYLLLTRMQQGLAWVVQLENTDCGH